MNRSMEIDREELTNELNELIQDLHTPITSVIGVDFTDDNVLLLEVEVDISIVLDTEAFLVIEDRLLVGEELELGMRSTPQLENEIDKIGIDLDEILEAIKSSHIIEDEYIESVFISKIKLVD